MGNCCGTGPVCSLVNKHGSNQDILVDIEKALLDYAWTKLADPTPMDRLFKEKRYDLEVNWAHLDIQHKVTRFKYRARETDSQSPESKVKKRDLCLFSSVFKNDTGKEQTFTFKTERETKSTASVSIQRGFQLGGHLDLTMSIPIPGQEAAQAAAALANQEIEAPCKVTGGLSGQFHVTKVKGQTFEERVTWSVDTQVKVEPNKTCRAQLIITEKELQADMTIESTIRAVYPVIQVYLRHKQSKVTVPLEIPAKNLSSILSIDKGFKQRDAEITTEVQCESKGIMHVIFGAEQSITIDHNADVDLRPELEEACMSQASSSAVEANPIPQGPIIVEVDEEESLSSAIGEDRAKEHTHLLSTATTGL